MFLTQLSTTSAAIRPPVSEVLRHGYETSPVVLLSISVVEQLFTAETSCEVDVRNSSFPHVQVGVDRRPLPI